MQIKVAPNGAKQASGQRPRNQQLAVRFSPRLISCIKRMAEDDAMKPVEGVRLSVIDTLKRRGYLRPAPPS